jgi:hypothetical protein
MPIFDWTAPGAVNVWQSVATISALIAGLYVLTRFLIRFWPWLKKVIAFFDALAQLPVFMVDTNKTMAEQNAKLADIHHEVHYNNGTSVKDSMERVELGVKGIYHRLDGLEESVEVLHETDEKLSDQIEEQTQPHNAVEEKEKP